jgi:acetylornithine deacetylase/succinyl-diaminopimelate desuccinylase-like protein
MDMKGPLAAATHGIASLAGLDGGTVIVCASVAEELVEGPALAAVAERRRPNYVIICEASSLRLSHGQRGRAEIIIELIGTPTHSSRPELGVNAVELMADVLAELRGLRLPTHRKLGPAILVPTEVMSRPYPALSVVPDYCVATFDRRTLPGESLGTILDPIREVVDVVVQRAGGTAIVRVAEDDFATYSGYRIRAPNFAQAWFENPAGPLIACAAHGLERAGLPAETTTYAFCTNGSATAGLGIPTLGFGPGDEEQAHRVDEHVELDQLVRGAIGYAGICRQLIEESP